MFETPIPARWVAILADWAEANGRVQQVYLYGSRIKGTHRSTSDLDMALVLSDEPENGFVTWMFEADNWRAEVSNLLPVEVHLELALPDDKTVWPAICDHGVMIFSRP